MKTPTNQEEGVYIIKRVKRLPKTGSCNYLYTIKEDNLTIFYRYLADQTIEKIELAPSLFGSVYIQAGENIILTGNGSEENPYIINSAINQNNKTITINAVPYINGTFGREYYFETSISAAVNNSEVFSVEDDEICVVGTTYTEASIAGTTFKKEYYLLKTGKGNYGQGQTTTTELDYFLIRSEVYSQIPSVQVSAPEVYTIQADDVTLPELAVNTSSQQYVVTSQADVYFVITTPPTIDPSESNIYRFVGANGTYGQGGSTTVLADFILVEDLSTPIEGQIENTSQLNNDGQNGTDPFITLSEVPAVDFGDRGQIIPIDVAGANSYGLRGVNRSLDHIALGPDTMDLTQKDSMAQVGIGGQAGFGYGFDLFSAAGSFGSTIFGYNNQILGGQMQTIFGQNNIINTGYADFLVGVENVVTSPLGYTFTTGRNNLQAGRYSASLGVGLINRGYGTVVGTANLDDKGSTTTPTANNPLFIVGNGSLSNDQFNVALVRSDAFVIYQDGRVIAPSLTNALINTNVKSLVTKEYADVIEAKVDTNTAKHIEGTPDNITFNTAATPVADVEGLLQWNTTEDTLDLSANGVTYQLGQEISPLVRNNTGLTITNGTPVMFAGTLGASSRVLITPAIADNTIPSSYVLGTTTEDILNGADGHVTWFGKVRGIDTTGTPYGETWANQDILYVSPTTAGYLTNVKPSAPNAQIFIGVVISAHATTGSYFIRPSWRGGITDLDDVNGTPLTTDGQILVWDDTNQYFDPTLNILTIVAASVQKTGETTQSIAGDIVVANNVIGQSFISPLVTIVENTLLTIANSDVIIDALSVPVTATLPAVESVPIGKKYTVIAYDVTNTITLASSNSEQIREQKSDTLTSIVLPVGQKYTVANTGTYWIILNKS